MNWFVDKLGPNPGARGATAGGSPVAKTGQPVNAPASQPQRAAAPPQPAKQAAAPRPAAPPPAPAPEPEKKKKKGWF
jgi:hypothetical protein